MKARAIGGPLDGQFIEANGETVHVPVAKVGRPAEMFIYELRERQGRFVLVPQQEIEIKCTWCEKVYPIGEDPLGFTPDGEGGFICEACSKLTTIEAFRRLSMSIHYCMKTFKEEFLRKNQQ